MLPRALRERTGKTAGDCVEQQHGGQLTPRQDVGAHGDRVGGEVPDDALVEPLET